MIIDFHSHVNWHGYDAARIVANLDEHGIDAACLQTWIAPEHEIDSRSRTNYWPETLGMPVEHVLNACEKYPERLIPFYAPDPRSPHALEHLQSAVTNCGVRGFGELKVRVMLDNPHLIETLQYCGEEYLPAVIHMDIPLPPDDPTHSPGYWYCAGWENLERMLEACPKTIICGHAPGFWREISGDAGTEPKQYPDGPVTPNGRLWTTMKRYPNLYCDLSAGSGLTAISRDRERGREFLLQYAERCLFGRDGFDSRHYDYLRNLALPADALANIMGGNAARILRPESAG